MEQTRTAMATKHYSLPNSNSTCYVDHVPPEIAGLICYFSKEEDVPHLRLVSKFWNNVATPFLLSDVNLVFKPESLQRLLDISRHPVISKQITSLYYEPNTLDEYSTQHAWEMHVYDCDYMEDFEARPVLPAFDASERERRAFRRNVTKIRRKPRHNYSKSYLAKAYKEYSRMYAEQEDLRNRDYGLEDLSEAMSRLPNLSKIWVNYSWGAKNAFAAGLIAAGRDYCGIPFMRSLLLAVHGAGLELGTLKLGSVNWKFVKQSDRVLERMKIALRRLTTLELAITTGLDESGNEFGVEVTICRKYLSRYAKLAEFLAAAPNLKDLTIGFDWNEPSSPAELNQIFGSTTWRCLESIALEKIDAASETLSRFFEQHASTLKHVAMRDMRLQEGTWVETFERMKKALNLKSAYMMGHILGENPHQHWILEPDLWVEYSDLSPQGARTRKAIENYLVQGGDTCPLLDGDMHPQSSW